MKGTEFLDRFLRQILSDLHTLAIGRIEDYDPVLLKAEVSIMYLSKYKDHEPLEIPLIVEVPVAAEYGAGFLSRMPYERGDLVLVGFSERAIDEIINTGEKALPKRKTFHSLDDAIVIKGINPFNVSLPGAHGEDFIVGLLENGDWFSFIAIEKETGHIILEMDEERRIVIEEERILIQFDDMGEIEINEDQEINIRSELDVNVNSEGDCNINAAGDANVNAEGDVDINAAGNADIDAAGNVNLQGGSAGIARIGDAVQVTVPSGSSAGVHSGTITEGSDRAYSG